jgi:hypothetical protein
VRGVPIALSHKLSDAGTIRLDAGPDGKPVVEIEFRFVRYRLVIDDDEKALEVVKQIMRAVKEKPGEKREKVKLPDFYRDDVGAQRLKND